MNDYSAVPNEYRVPEYNPTGDSGNGYAGTVTPGAIANQNNSSTSGGGNNPYADILNYLPKPAAAPAPITTSPPVASAPADPAAPPPQLGDTPSLPATPPAGAPPAASTPARMRPSTPPVVYSDANPPPKPANTEDPNVAAGWYRQFSYVNPAFSSITTADVTAYRNDPQGKSFADWYLAGNRGPVDPTPPNPLAGTGMGDAPPGSIFPPAGPPASSTPPPAQQPSSPAPYDGGGGTPAPYSATPPPAAGNPQPAAPPASNDYSGILAQLQKLMGGQFDYEQTQLNRRLNAQAAVTGDMNSGGFGEVSGRANAQLTADEGNRLSGYLNTDWQSALDRALQTYGINTQAATSHDVATIGANAAQAGASASAGASRYATDAALQEAMLRDKTSRYQGDQQYNLGLAGLGLDQYKFDNPNINALLGYYMQMSPEQLAQFASNPQLFPGYAYTPHP